MSSDEFENNDLSNAAREGDLDKVQHLLRRWQSNFAPAQLTPQHLNSALIEAVSYHQIIVLAFGSTQESIKMFQTFLDHGWNINSRTALGFPILKHVVRDESLTRWFLEHGANPSIVGEPGTNILDVIAANSTPTVFELLLQYGAELEESNALHSAAGELKKTPGRVEMMKFLLDKGMDLNMLWRREYPAGRRMGRGTPLHAATSSQQPDRIMLLLERGADPEAKNTLGQTPLEYAIGKNLATSIEVLQDHTWPERTRLN